MLFQDEEQGLTRAHIEAHRENHESLALDCHAKHTSPSARLNLIVVGSGSKGNASVVYDRVTGEGILIDAGICKRDVFAFSAEGGFDMAKLKGVLISHNHSDHVKNLGVILRGLRARDIEVPALLASRNARREQGAQTSPGFERDRLLRGGPEAHDRSLGCFNPAYFARCACVVRFQVRMWSRCAWIHHRYRRGAPRGARRLAWGAHPRS